MRGLLSEPEFSEFALRLFALLELALAFALAFALVSGPFIGWHAPSNAITAKIIPTFSRNNVL